MEPPHSCKVCKRTFPNGRSLGGHMRSHVMLKSPFNQEESSESRYGLREKPKKSKWFDDDDDDDDDDGEVEQEEKESWSTGVDDGREEEMRMKKDHKQQKNRTRRRKSKLVQAISSSSSSPAHSSAEYGALCLMMLSRGAKRSESDILRIGIKKVDSFTSESEFRFEDEELEFNKGGSFAAALQPGKKRKSPKSDFDAEIENFSKRSKYECTLCNKSFHSYQALGGHCASHKKNRAASSSSVSAAVTERPISKKCRIYECPICGKVFSSGQALGGHKRSHLIAGNSANSSAAISTEVNEIEQNNSKLGSLDLNLPASDFEICDSFDSNRSISEDKFTVFSGNLQSFSIIAVKQSAELKLSFS